MKINYKNKPALTLLELLITLFIISIIISLSVVVYDVSWAKSRNSQRVSDIIRVQNALESYHLQEGKYPDTLTFGEVLIGESTSSPITYLAALPNNPTPRTDGDCTDQEYQYSTSTNAYGDDNFFIEFCVGNDMDQIEKGINCATSQGIVHGACNSIAITYTLTYTAGAGGSIIGISPQTVNSGEDGSEVLASPDTGYSFVNWSDGSATNPRTDTNVTGNISVTANFADNGQNVWLGTTNNDWGTATNWSRGTVPTATDGYITTFNASSPNCTVDTSNRVANAIDFTNYTNTITFTFQLLIYGNVTLGAGMHSSGTALFGTIASGILTSNGYTGLYNFRFYGTSQTYTLADNWTVVNLWFSGTTASTINEFTIYVTGSLTSNTASDTSGTTNIIMNGTGTLSSSTYNCHLMLNLTINTTGTITMGTSFAYKSATFIYITGTVIVPSNSTFYIIGTLTLDLSGITWNHISNIIGNSLTVTLLSDLNMKGNLTLAGSNVTYTINGLYNVNVGGNLTLTALTLVYVTGTATIVLNGTGTWSHTGAGYSYVRSNLIINTGGTITLGANVYYYERTFTYIAGTVDTTTNDSTLNVGRSATGATLNLNGLTLNNLYLSTTSGTISLASGLVIGGLFSNIDSASHILVRYLNGSKFPPGFSNTYVKATTEYSSSYAAHIATNPNISLTGTYAGASWISANGSKTDQRFHIDLGTAKVIDRIYYENLHHLGGVTNRGAKNFTFWGSNSAADFADLVYANDGTWVQLTTDVSQFKQHIASDIPDPKYVNVKNTTAYRYYAFKFDDNWGYAGFMGVRRIELQQTPVETQAVITLLPGGTQNLRMVDATNIDSSAGQTIISVGGILSNTLNWSN